MVLFKMIHVMDKVKFLEKNKIGEEGVFHIFWRRIKYQEGIWSDQQSGIHYRHFTSGDLRCKQEQAFLLRDAAIPARSWES